MKQFFKRTLIILIIIFSLFPILFSGVGVSFADMNEDVAVPLTQERAGNFVSTFAINFFNNWSSDNHTYSDSGDPVRTRFSEVWTLPSEGDSIYTLSRTSWLDFVYKESIGVDGIYFPSRNFTSETYYEITDVSDMITVEEYSQNHQNETDEEGNPTLMQTTEELINSGKIKPGDILVTDNGSLPTDYLLFVGGTKVIYATPDDTGTGALKYDYLQNYYRTIERKLLEGHEDDDEFEPKHGLKSVIRLKQDTIDSIGITDKDVKTFYNQRGYYDKKNKYSGIPVKSSYDGSTHRSFFAFAIEGLFQIAKFIIMLIPYMVRAVFVGWINLFESLFQSIIFKLSGLQNPVSFVDKLQGVSATTYSGDRITIESLFFNQLPLTDANFYDFEQAGGHDISGSWISEIRHGLAIWYNIIRNISIAFMLFALLYTGIRMALSNVAQKKADYKQMFSGWVIGMVIVLGVHFFMIAVLQTNNIFVDFLRDRASDIAAQSFGGDSQVVSLYDAIRTKAYEFDFYEGTVGLVLYAMMVWIFIKFIFVYFKRMISVYVLALFGSLTGVKYAIDRATGKRGSGTFSKWMREFIFNVLLQTIHALLYVVMIGISINIAFTSYAGIFIVIIVFQFMLKTDKLVMKIFGVKGGLLDDVQKPPPSLNTVITNAGMIAGIAAVPYGIAKGVFGENAPVRQLLRYGLYYEDGDDAADIQRKSDLFWYKVKGKVGGLGYKAINKLPIQEMADYKHFKRRMEIHELLASDKVSYEDKRNLYLGIKKRKQQKREYFKRPIEQFRSKLAGVAQLTGALASSADGLTSSIVLTINGVRTLKGKGTENARLYRRVGNPATDKKLMYGNSGLAFMLEQEKRKKAMKKAQDKESIQIEIARLEMQLSDKLAALRELEKSGVSHDDIYEDLVRTAKAANKVTIKGTGIRSAVNRYINSTGKEKLNASDIDGVLAKLSEEVAKTNSSVKIDDKVIKKVKDSVRDNSISMDGLEGKEFAKALAQAFKEGAVIDRKVKHTVDNAEAEKLLNESFDLMKQIKGLNEMNVAKNKESAYNYGGSMSRLFGNYGYKEVSK